MNDKDSQFKVNPELLRKCMTSIVSDLIDDDLLRDIHVDKNIILGSQLYIKLKSLLARQEFESSIVVLEELKEFSFLKEKEVLEIKFLIYSESLYEMKANMIETDPLELLNFIKKKLKPVLLKLPLENFTDSLSFLASFAVLPLSASEYELTEKSLSLPANYFTETDISLRCSVLNSKIATKFPDNIVHHSNEIIKAFRYSIGSDNKSSMNSRPSKKPSVDFAQVLFGPKSEVWCVKYSPCGIFIFSISKDGALFIHQRQEGLEGIKINFSLLMFYQFKELQDACMLAVKQDVEPNFFQLAAGTTSGDICLLAVDLRSLVGTQSPNKRGKGRMVDKSRSKSRSKSTVPSRDPSARFIREPNSLPDPIMKLTKNLVKKIIDICLISPHVDQISSLKFEQFTRYDEKIEVLVSSSMDKSIVVSSNAGEELCRASLESSIYSCETMTKCSDCLKRLPDKKIHFMIGTGGSEKLSFLSLGVKRKKKKTEEEDDDAEEHADLKEKYTMKFKFSEKSPSFSKICFEKKKPVPSNLTEYDPSESLLDGLSVKSINSAVTNIKLTHCACNEACSVFVTLLNDGIYQFSRFGRPIRRYIDTHARFFLLPSIVINSVDKEDPLLIVGSESGELKVFETHSTDSEDIVTVKPVKMMSVSSPNSSHSATINSLDVFFGEKGIEMVSASDDATLNIYSLNSITDSVPKTNRKLNEDELRLNAVKHTRSIVTAKKRTVYSFDPLVKLPRRPRIQPSRSTAGSVVQAFQEALRGRRGAISIHDLTDFEGLRELVTMSPIQRIAREEEEGESMLFDRSFDETRTTNRPDRGSNFRVESSRSVAEDNSPSSSNDTS